MTGVFFLPSKKRRIHAPLLVASSEDKASGQKATSALFFDILPPNTITNVIRFRSESPRAEKWRNYIYLNDIAELYGVDGELGVSMNGLCNALHICECTGAHDYSPLDGAPKEAIRCNPEALKDLIYRLPKHTFGSFSTLVVRDVGDGRLGELAGTVATHLPSIRELVLMDLGTLREIIWINKVGAHVESLRCRRCYMIVPLHCPLLRQIYLESMPLTLREPTLWKSLGGALETLVIYTRISATIDITGISKYCRKINRLEMTGNNDGVRDAISKTESQVRRVKDACPRTRVVLVTTETLLGPSLNIVGSELEEVGVDEYDYTQGWDELSVDWTACTHVNKAKFNAAVTSEYIGRFLESRKCHLLAMDLHIYGDLDNVKRAIALIANGTGALEEFSVAIHAAAKGIFEGLVQTNRSIRDVAVDMLDSGNADEVATDLVTTFLNLPAIRNIEIELPGRINEEGEIKGIEAICRGERHRRVCIFVFGIFYLR